MKSTAWARWRARLNHERPLLRELAVLLLACLMVGIYFLEHLDARLAQSRISHLEALARQTAHAAGDYIVGGNLVSLNVIARQTGSLAPVARVQLEDAGGRVLASHGDETHGPQVSQPVRLGDQGIVGNVTLWSASQQATRQQVEAGFVLIVLCLLGLRVVATLVYRRLNGEPLWAAPEEVASEAAVPGVASEASETGEATETPPLAVLHLTVVNLVHWQARYTEERWRSMLAPYDALLRTVTGLYGARRESGLADGAVLSFAADAETVLPREAAFHGVCAGMLFLRVARRLGEQRKEAGEPALEFKALVTTDVNGLGSSACCEAGTPGRVHVPENELVALELDTRSLYRPEQALTVQRGEDDSFRLQPLEQLAQRYQKLINDQAARIHAH
ncbi:hypothetical protein [Isoalcanivorax indicus]|uniref:hypothetical protein n=1 Tax=Isoalcanivorax indicus TaxID=2202653 RepID=UPI0013C46141|nr:hypothetical protein [Isoalcanivorax indicus]